MPHGRLLSLAALAVALLLVAASTSPAAADLHKHRYQFGEEVVAWANKVGPFQNPQETYAFYSLPFCKPAETVQTSHEGLGEALQGYELVKSAIELRFRQDISENELCTVTLTKSDAKKLAFGIKHQYWYQFYIDDLPVWGMVGMTLAQEDGTAAAAATPAAAADTTRFVYTHQRFEIGFNEDRVISVDLAWDRLRPVAPGETVTYTYSVAWKPSAVAFEDRFDKYLDNQFFEHRIHWFSILNSAMMVIFLVGLVAMILMRNLRQDYARYAQLDEEDANDMDDSGWKLVHADVFRPPQHLVLFSALVGTGQQLAVLVLAVVLLSLLGSYYAARGTAVTAFIICYALTAVIGGYGSGSLYLRNGGKQWIKVMLMTASLFPLSCLAVGFFLNFIAICYHSLAYMPLGAVTVVLLIWGLVAFPLTLLGTLLGRHWGGHVDNPCRVAQVPRQITEKPWYLEPSVNIMVSGVLPFGSIFIEIYFIFTSFWGYKYYYVYGFMLLVFVILTVVTMCVAVVSTYFLLNSEDYRWHWTSFLSGASTAFYVFLYAVYYFVFRTRMTGFFQTVFYFGYMSLFCLGLGVMAGGVGYLAADWFVRKIYANIKVD